MKVTPVILGLLKDLSGFAYSMSSLDPVWHILFPAPGNRWRRIHISRYQDTYYVSDVNGDEGMLEVTPKQDIKVLDKMGFGSSHALDSNPHLAKEWQSLATLACKWLKVVRRDWIKANRQVQDNYPMDCRYGIVPNALVRASLPDVYRIDRELGKVMTQKLVRLVEEGFFRREEHTVAQSMTAADYFRYCRIAYIAARRKGERLDLSLSGREMYARYADGRHEGLLDIDENSEQEFADWLDGKHPKRACGGHPWEIKRGGNTTHINLAVMRPSVHSNEGFKVELCGASIGRMVETMRMLLAIHKEGLPISMWDYEGVRKRLLAQDNIGIVASYDSLHRANQRFPREQDVYDVLYYNDLGRFKRRLTPFITWEPLPILKRAET